MVAGFIAGYLEKKDYEYAFHMGIASGSASAFSEQLATRAEVEALLKTIPVSYTHLDVYKRQVIPFAYIEMIF